MRRRGVSTASPVFGRAPRMRTGDGPRELRGLEVRGRTTSGGQCSRLGLTSWRTSSFVSCSLGGVPQWIQRMARAFGAARCRRADVPGRRYISPVARRQRGGGAQRRRPRDALETIEANSATRHDAKVRCRRFGQHGRLTGLSVDGSAWQFQAPGMAVVDA